MLSAMAKRWVVILIAFYYDDATIQDLTMTRLSGQVLVRRMMALVGLPLAPNKAKDLDSKADYLGLVHDVEALEDEGVVRFEPRPKIAERSKAMIEKCLSEDWATPAQIAKLRGILGFQMTATYGQIGRGGANALIRRQYSDTWPYRVKGTHLEKSLEYFRDVQELCARREVKVWGNSRPPIVAASDGRKDDEAPSSVGVLLVDPESGKKVAFSAIVPVELEKEWGEEGTIAAVEQAAVVIGIIEAKRFLEGRDIVWYIDNSVILAAQTKGAAHGPRVDECALCLHLMLAKLKARVWWEYVQTGSNWADALSRQVKPDEWMAKVGFHHRRVDVPWWPWQVEPCTRLERVRRSRGQRRGVYVPALGNGARRSSGNSPSRDDDTANAEPGREMSDEATKKVKAEDYDKVY